jgi:lambda repressor-like predicted transcriptional regulator
MPPTDAKREAVVAALEKRGGEATCQDLATDTGLHVSTVRNALRRLEWTHDVERIGGPRSTKQQRAVFRLVRP